MGRISKETVGLGLMILGTVAILAAVLVYVKHEYGGSSTARRPDFIQKEIKKFERSYPQRPGLSRMFAWGELVRVVHNQEEKYHWFSWSDREGMQHVIFNTTFSEQVLSALKRESFQVTTFWEKTILRVSSPWKEQCYGYNFEQVMNYTMARMGSASPVFITMKIKERLDENVPAL